MGATPKAPEAPYFQPINISDAITQALAYDESGFRFSDDDFAARFPGLVSTRNDQIDDAYKQLTGPLDPTVEADFINRGLSQGLGAVGGGDPLSGLGLTQGSFGRNVASASVANSALAKQDYDRAYFEQLIGNNPQRSFGISGGDVANLSIANTGGLNSSNQLAYQSTLAGIYGAGQQGVSQGQQIAAIGSLLAQLGRSGG